MGGEFSGGGLDEALVSSAFQPMMLVWSRKGWRLGAWKGIREEMRVQIAIFRVDGRGACCPGREGGFAGEVEGFSGDDAGRAVGGQLEVAGPEGFYEVVAVAARSQGCGGAPGGESAKTTSARQLSARDERGSQPEVAERLRAAVRPARS